jgi:hypothetical protein
MLFRADGAFQLDLQHGRRGRFHPGIFTLDHLWGYKNMIFVCHSMGGVAVRRKLSAFSDNRDKMRTI